MKKCEKQDRTLHEIILDVSELERRVNIDSDIINEKKLSSNADY